jgi:hypothetical protein
MSPAPPDPKLVSSPEWGFTATEEKAMLNDTERVSMARQRERDLIQLAERERQARAARKHRSGSDSRGRDD